MAAFKKSVVTRRDGSKEYYTDGERVSKEVYDQTETFQQAGERKRAESKASVERRLAESAISKLETKKIITPVEAQELRSAKPVFEGNKLVGFQVLRQKITEQQAQETKQTTSIGVLDRENQVSRQATPFETLAAKAIIEKEQYEASLQSREPGQAKTLSELSQEDKKDVIFYEINPKTGDIGKAITLKSDVVPAPEEKKAAGVIEASTLKRPDPISRELKDYGTAFLQGFTFQEQERPSSIKQLEVALGGRSELNQFQVRSRDLAFTTGAGVAIGAELTAKGASKVIGTTGKYISKIPYIGEPIVDFTSAAGAKLLRILEKPSVQTQLGLLAAGDVGLTYITEGDVAAARGSANIVKDVSIFAGTVKNLKTESLSGYKADLDNQVIVRDIKVPELIKKDISVDVYGRPFQAIEGVRVESITPEGKVQKSALNIALGEPELITTKAPNYVEISGVRDTEFFIGRRADIVGESKLPVSPRELTQPTGFRTTVQTPYKQYLEAGYFENVLSNNVRSVKSLSDEITITDINPRELDIIGTQTRITTEASDVPQLNIEQFTGNIRGIEITGKEFTTDLTVPKSARGRKTTVEIKPDELSAEFKQILSGKELKTFEFGNGQVGQQLYVYDRADITLNRFGTNINPVFEAFTQPKYSYSATVGIFEKPKKTTKNKPIVDIDNEDFKVSGGGETVTILEKPKTKKENIVSELEEIKIETEQEFKQEELKEPKQDLEEDQELIRRTRRRLDEAAEKKQRQNQRIDEGFRFVPLEGFRSSQKTGQDIGLKQPVDFREAQDQKIDQQAKQLQDTLERLDLEQGTQQKTRLDRLFKPTRAERLREFAEPTPLIPSLNIPFSQSINAPLFDVQVGKKSNKFFFERKGLTLQEAVSFGRSRVKSTAAASLKITPRDNQDRRYLDKIEQQLGGQFSRSKKDEDTFIQEKEFRISSLGEKEQITALGLETIRRKDIKRLF